MLEREVQCSFCESCVEGKHHTSKFPVNKSKRAQEPLDIVHSDVCGKINERSLSGAEYFLTFIDDKTRYVWLYALKQKMKYSRNSLNGNQWWKDRLDEN